MNFFKQVLQQFGLNLLAIAVFAADVYRYVQLAQWEARLPEMVVAFFGMMAVVAADEMADWLSGYGWTRQTYRVQPTWWFRLLGTGCLIWATLRLFLS